MEEIIVVVRMKMNMCILSVLCNVLVLCIGFLEWGIGFMFIIYVV